MFTYSGKFFKKQSKLCILYHHKHIKKKKKESPQTWRKGTKIFTVAPFSLGSKNVVVFYLLSFYSIYFPNFL